MQLFLRLLALASFAALPVSSGFAAAYIKFDGIDGESTDKGHEKWINLASITDLPGPTTREAGSGMATGRRIHKPISIVKPIDKASPQLARARTAGTVFPTLTLSHEGRIYTLTNARVAGIATSGSTETISVSFEDFKVTDAPPPRATDDRPRPQVQAAEPASRPRPTNP